MNAFPDWKLVQQDMSAANDFPPANCSFKYLVCATPRTGSELLCTGLAASGQAGRPAEYLSRPYTEAYKLRFGLPHITMNGYWDFLLRHRTSPNGVFGLKMHYEYVPANFRDEGGPIRLVKTFDRLILLQRRDRVAQAISLWKANVTGIYRVSAGGGTTTPRKTPYYSYEEIAKRLETLVQHERSWRTLLANVPERVISLTYEELGENYAGAIRRVLTALGLDQAARSVDPAPQLVKQRQALDEEWKSRFLEEARNDGRLLDEIGATA